MEIWRRFSPAFAGDTAGRQLALSETLLAGPSEPGLWWYSAARPALILGTSQKPDVADREQCRASRVALYRRTSGGTAVFAEPDFVSLDVILPPDHPLAPSDVVQTYRWLGQVWLETLKTLAVPDLRLVSVEEVRAAKAAAPATPQHSRFERLARLVCFGSLSPYEVVLGQRKLVGLAQIRRRGGTLLQCGLPLRPQFARFAPLLSLSRPDRALLTAMLPERLVSLEEVSGKIFQPDEIVAAFETALQNFWPVRFEAAAWSSEQLDLANQLEQTKFNNLT